VLKSRQMRPTLFDGSLSFDYVFPCMGTVLPSLILLPTHPRPGSPPWRTPALSSDRTEISRSIA
jgi:hypothetical protein